MLLPFLRFQGPHRLDKRKDGGGKGSSGKGDSKSGDGKGTGSSSGMSLDPGLKPCADHLCCLARRALMVRHLV